MIVLTSAWDNQVVQVNPGFPNQIRLLIVIENRDLQFEVIGRLVYCESELMVPETIYVSHLAGNNFVQ